MDYKDIQGYFLATMEQFQANQREITRLTVSLDSVIETLKQQLPTFADSYAMNLESGAHLQVQSESECLIERLEAAIRGLSESL